MTRASSREPIAGPTRSGKVILFVVAAPFFAASSFAAIVYVGRLLDYDIIRYRVWDFSWHIGHFLACALLLLALGSCEGLRAGSLAKSTILGIIAGTIAFYVVHDWRNDWQNFLILPLQYGLIGFLIGWIAYRYVEREVPSSRSQADGAENSAERT